MRQLFFSWGLRRRSVHLELEFSVEWIITIQIFLIFEKYDKLTDICFEYAYKKMNLEFNSIIYDFLIYFK